MTVLDDYQFIYLYNVQCAVFLFYSFVLFIIFLQNKTKQLFPTFCIMFSFYSFLAIIMFITKINAGVGITYDNLPHWVGSWWLAIKIFILVQTLLFLIYFYYRDDNFIIQGTINEHLMSSKQKIFFTGVSIGAQVLFILLVLGLFIFATVACDPGVCT